MKDWQDVVKFLSLFLVFRFGFDNSSKSYSLGVIL